MNLRHRAILAAAVLVSALAAFTVAPAQVPPSKGKTYYVRQTVGDDANDGLSAKTAWQHVTKLSAVMAAGDTAYVGPGLYREEIVVLHDGTASERLVFIGDTTGQHTGDPPGAVMITGADPVDATIFAPHSSPGVYRATLSGPLSAYPVAAVVEMDGPQSRYTRVRSRSELPKDLALPETYSLDTVAREPSSFYYETATKALYLHTSDGKPPGDHEVELVHRGNGISMTGKHHVTVSGFTFRHVGDAGINFFRGSSGGLAINNTSYGSRQGIRVYGATNVVVQGNTLFRNENSGVYFAAQSTNGWALGNVAYENVKGLRWSSDSSGGVAADNALWDNHERGLAIENTARMILRGNRLVNNATSQLLVIRSEYSAQGNCFENRGPVQLTADFFFVDRYRTLKDYQAGQRRDLDSRDGDCGSLPGKVDVKRLHEETTRYAERARKLLGR